MGATGTPPYRRAPASGSAPRPASIFAGVAAPAPRYLMRLDLLRRLIALLPPDTARFLEIGPGMGDVALHLASRLPRAQGLLLDFSPQCVEVLDRRLGGHPRLRPRLGDLSSLTDRAAYDLVVACEVFEHIADDDAAFDAVGELLRPGGYFLFSAPAFMRKWQAADEFAGHFRRYERAELVAKFDRHGFDIERLWSYGFPVTHLLYPIRQMYYAARRRRAGLSKSQATMASGVDRALATKLRGLPIARLLAPGFVCQYLVRNTNLGDGFVALVRRRPGGRAGRAARP